VQSFSRGGDLARRPILRSRATLDGNPPEGPHASLGIESELGLHRFAVLRRSMVTESPSGESAG